MIYIINIDYKKQEDLNMKRKILSMVLLGIMVLGVSGTANAKSKKKLIDSSRHYILESSHPSPLSANRGFFGCGHFKKVNQILKKLGKKEIDWQI